MTLTYNYLNLPGTVTKGSDVLTYIYDAAGNKLAEKLNGMVNNFYTGAVVYKGDKTIDYIPTSTGLIRKVGSDFIRQYNINDHLGSTRSIVNQSGTIEQANDYYPYGLAFNYNNLDKNRYLYNGKELQNQTLAATFFGLCDYGARYYDPVAGRWNGVDPLAEKYPGLSTYAYCANNPIRYIDPTGMEFTEDAWKQVNRLIDDINKRQAKNAASIGEKQAQINAGGLSEKQVSKLQKQIDRLNSNTSELESTRGEIATLAASDQMYDIKSDNSMNINGPISGMGETRGGAAFNFSNGNFEISLGDGGLGMLSHELKHTYQFETGAFSSGYRRDGVPFYDKTDELEAYTRGALFGGERINTLPSLYDNLQSGPMDATKLAPIILGNPAELQKLADRTKSSFRVNGVTYIMQGGK